MPTYEYECKNCGVRFERRQKWHDEPVKHCPECQGDLRKVIQPVGIVFKGSGFYKTDNPSSSSRRDKEKDKEKSEGETKPEAKVEAKTEAKPEAKPATGAEEKSPPKAEEKSVEKETK